MGPTRVDREIIRTPSASEGRATARLRSTEVGIAPDGPVVPPSLRGFVASSARSLALGVRMRGTNTKGTVRSAFTLVELLVAVGIMVVLLSAILVAASTLHNKAKVTSTQALLTVVQNAVDEFHREQKAKPTLCRDDANALKVEKYTNRYGFFPPDEIEVFSTSAANPVERGRQRQSLAPGKAQIVPAPPYEKMKFYTRGLTPEEAAKEHRDLAAMILAIQLYGDASTTILDGIQERYRTPGAVDTKGNPALFLDRRTPGTWTPSEDLQIRLIVDDWGNPLSYFAQRDWVQTTTGADTPPPSLNHDDWNEASTELVRLNGGRPVIVSYGADGAEQLTPEAMGAGAAASMVGDFEDEFPKPHGVIDHPFNDDNVYADPGLKEKLAKQKAE